MEKAILAIQGMSCGSCIAHVKQTLSSLNGVTIEGVEIGRAVVSFDPSAIEPLAIARAVTEHGYPAQVISAVPGR